MLHAGDAYFYRGEMRAAKRHCTPGLRGYQTMMETDRRLRLANQERLRKLSVQHQSEVRIFCAHDVVELERCQRGAPL
jgi:hypothetical protein